MERRIEQLALAEEEKRVVWDIGEGGNVGVVMCDRERECWGKCAIKGKGCGVRGEKGGSRARWR